MDLDHDRQQCPDRYYHRKPKNINSGEETKKNIAVSLSAVCFGSIIFAMCGLTSYLLCKKYSLNELVS